MVMVAVKLCNFFELPASICNTLTTLTRNFWWSTDSNKKPIYWKSWDQLCRTKCTGGMGFRDIHSFNLAMLGKKAWSIWNKSHSLVARCLKAKYFAATDFLSASLGNRLSYLWRSLLAGKDVLQMGLRYRVGNGETISVYEDKWLPRPFSFKLMSPDLNYSQGIRVCELIDCDTLQWRHDLLLTLFLPMDVEEILKIPLTHMEFDDRLVWHFTSNGTYSVKSAHRMLQIFREVLTGQASSSELSGATNVWKKLWKLSCLPKAKIFLWKAVHNILPTASNLARRLNNLAPQCMLCGTREENDYHLLFECPWIASVWDEVTFGHKLGKLKASCFKDLLQFVLEWPNETEIVTFVHLCSLIWKTRCAMVFQSGHKSKGALLVEAQTLTNSLQPSCQHQSCFNPPHLQSKWTRPVMGTISINGDVALACTGASSAGIIARDHQGVLVEAASIRLPSNIAVEHGELLAICHALKLGLNLHATAVEIWSDSLNCITLLRSSSWDCHPLATLLYGM